MREDAQRQLASTAVRGTAIGEPFGRVTRRADRWQRNGIWSHGELRCQAVA